MRPRFEWKLRSRSLKLGERTLIMGVINVTPDSFSDGGEFLDPQRAVERGLELLSDGADILDIGGESTRPGKKDPVSAVEEKRRVLPVIRDILRQAPRSVLSIDTYKAETAHAALDAGAEIVNDVSGFTWDERMLPFLAGHKCGCVLMHTRGRPEEWPGLPALARDSVVPLVLGDLRRLSHRAVSTGIDSNRIVLDPGFGFGKRLDENYPLLARLGELHELGFPLLAGTSRKSFVGARRKDGKSTAADRLPGTLASTTAAILHGAHIIRVHDVRSALEAAKVADSILEAQKTYAASAQVITI
jgi:dihydropteroate synthase